MGDILKGRIPNKLVPLKHKVDGRWVRPVLQVTLDGFQEAVAVFVPEELVQGNNL